jgi:hypothetical protein
MPLRMAAMAGRLAPGSLVGDDVTTGSRLASMCLRFLLASASVRIIRICVTQILITHLTGEEKEARPGAAVTGLPFIARRLHREIRGG